MARWSDLATWRGPSTNSGDGDGTPLEAADAVDAVRGLIVHIAEGFFEGTISWQKNPDANTSSHFIAGRAGGRAQMVDTHDRAWTQSAGNSRWLSVECEGFTLGHPLHRPDWHELTGLQIEFIAALFARIHVVFGVPLQLTSHPDQPGLGYHSMGAEQGFNWGHSDCPGEPIKAQLPAILARAQQIVNGDEMLTAEERTWIENIGNNVWAARMGIDTPVRPGNDPNARPAPAGVPLHDGIKKLLAYAAADETRDAATTAAVNALSELVRAGGGNVEVAPILERITAEATITRATVELRHQEEMAQLARLHQAQLDGRDAELAGLRAELERLTATNGG